MTPINDDMVDLKSCPICGGNEVMHGYRGPGDGSGVTPIIRCTVCSASVEGATFGIAIVRWNTRAALEGSVAVPAWQDVATYPNDNSIALVANPAAGSLPVIAWMVEDKWFAFDLSKREPLDPQPTIWTTWPSFPRQERGGEGK